MSSIISLEAAGTTFATTSGTSTDVFQVLKDAGVNSVRIRIWNDPYDTSGNTYGGGTNDAAVAVMIAERAADVGLGVMLSFHLSDFWADPDAQVVPKAWSSYTTAQKASATYTFVKETVEAVENTGVDIQFVTIGNETTAWSGVAGTSSMSDLATIFVQGAQAVRDVDTKIMIGVHVAPTDYTTTNVYSFASGLKGANSNIFDYFDFFSTSCYPYWSSHGSTTNDMTNFATQLNKINSTYGLPTMITEYNWPYVLGSDQDSSGYVEVSTDSTNGGYTDGSWGYWNAWDISRQGQADMIQDLNSYFAENVTDMMGTYYWEPTWIAAGNTSTSWGTTSSETAAINRWLNYGCGVATYYGATYLGWSGYTDPSTYSGSAVKYNSAAGSKTDEYTLFNVSGSAAASLAALGYSTDIMPIDTTLAQVSTATDGYCSLRFVGQVTLTDTKSYDTVGFKIEYCNSAGTSIKEISAKDTTLLYTKIIADSEEITPDDGSYYYAYKYDKVPATGTYYFKVMTTAKGTASYQQSTKYYKLANGTLSTVDAWDYPGTNASLGNTIYTTLYPSYMQ
jgi:arabinogalactan endo-1,4-beta-galactosidase